MTSRGNLWPWYMGIGEDHRHADTAARAEPGRSPPRAGVQAVSATDLTRLSRSRPGVRAAACYSVKLAQNSREHNDANVLTLGSGIINTQEMRDIVRIWLATEISEDRHRKRVAKIEAVERQYKC